MAWRAHRSRSPAGGGGRDADAISRQVCAFGRYPDKRPAGLRVDSRSGGFLLSNLMACWGVKQGYTLEAVFEALNNNMFYAPGGNQRFTLLHAPPCDVTIQVHRRNDNVRGGTACNLPASAAADAGAKASGGHWSAASTASTGSSGWKESQATSHDSRAGVWSTPDDTQARAPAKQKEQPWERSSWDQKAASWSGGDAWQQQGGQTSSSTSWWEAAQAKAKEGSKPGGATWKQDADTSSSWKGNGDSWQAAAGGASSSSSTAPWGSDAERIQRYIGYALKGGSSELGIAVDRDGWAWLECLATAMREKKPEWQLTDAQEVQRFLEETDGEGRFEVDGYQRVRKVPRDHRQTRTAPAAATASTHTGSSGGAGRPAPRTPPRGPKAARAVAAAAAVERRAASAGGAATSTGGAKAVSPGGHTAGSSPAAATAATAAKSAPVEGTPPPQPPGPGWTKYIDDEVYWWFYEGPHGKWWKQSEDDEILPWED